MKQSLIVTVNILGPNETLIQRASIQAEHLISFEFRIYWFYFKCKVIWMWRSKIDEEDFL